MRRRGGKARTPADHQGIFIGDETIKLKEIKKK
jgi:hypothetical protein